jgi:hypothetical protein
MGFFGIGCSKKKEAEEPKSVQRSMDSVAVAKKRMNKSKSQREAEEAAWAADDAEIAAVEASPDVAQGNEDDDDEPATIATYHHDASPAKPAMKSAMKKKSKFVQDSSGAAVVPS